MMIYWMVYHIPGITVMGVSEAMCYDMISTAHPSLKLAEEIPPIYLPEKNLKAMATPNPQAVGLPGRQVTSLSCWLKSATMLLQGDQQGRRDTDGHFHNVYIMLK